MTTRQAVIVGVIAGLWGYIVAHVAVSRWL